MAVYTLLDMHRASTVRILGRSGRVPEVSSLGMKDGDGDGDGDGSLADILLSTPSRVTLPKSLVYPRCMQNILSRSRRLQRSEGQLYV